MSEAAVVAAPQAGAEQKQEPSVAPVNPVLNGGGATAPDTDWRSTLPEDLRGNAALQPYKDLAGLAKSHVELQKMMGQPKLPAPQENWKPEQWGELYDKLGRPKTPQDYKFDVSSIPQGLQRDEAMEQHFAKAMHEHGLTQKQAEALHKQFIAYEGQRYQGSVKQQEQMREQSIQSLKQEWGDKFSANVDAANAALRNIGGDEMIQWVKQKGLDADPTLSKFLAKIGSGMAEDQVTGRKTMGGFTTSASQAMAEIGQLKADKDFMDAFNKNGHPGHKEAVQKWRELHRVAYPGR